ncbi:hypothetical protein ABT336_17605 [Micromonospora sp. NPDC000207]|uniref:hypothetical protein n=1 Tax=Micromonospora sp. NPDC000207 TaxID=3154246 RepID=UPI00331A45FE
MSQRDDEILAAHARGRTVRQISRTYGVSAQAVRRLVSGDPPPPPSKPVTRAPAPVIAVAVLMLLVGAVQIAGVLYFASHWSVWARLAVIVLGVSAYVLLAYGLWRGWRAARWTVAVVGGIAMVSGTFNDAGPEIASILLGGLLVALLFVPVRSRAWFGG